MSRFLDIPVDADGLRLAAAGDREAQRQLYGQVAGPVFALIRRMVAPRAAAEDVFQDCMVSLLRSLPGFRGDAPFGAWVRQVALRQCLMHLRSPWQRARCALEAVVAGNEAAAEFAAHQPRVEAPQPELLDVERALAALPDVARAVVWMFDVEGMSHEEIAAVFGRTVSFSKSQLSRAHALLRNQLSEAAPARAGAIADPGVAAHGQVLP
jgi:RNA polymerase sigma-70 factor (ECF subfamily)